MSTLRPLSDYLAMPVEELRAECEARGLDTRYVVETYDTRDNDEFLLSDFLEFVSKFTIKHDVANHKVRCEIDINNDIDLACDASIDWSDPVECQAAAHRLYDLALRNASEAERVIVHEREELARLKAKYEGAGQ